MWNPDLEQVTVVLVTYESQHCMEELGVCLAGFKNVIVVDNASKDDTVAMARERLPHAQVLVNERNLGFGAANNRAIHAARTAFVLLLNPDCVVDDSAVVTLLSALEDDPSAAGAGPQLVGRGGRLDLSYCMRSGGAAAQGPAAEGLICVGFISGACMLFRRADLLRVEGFDEGFFLYQEDADLCRRIQAQGRSLLVVPQSRVTHWSRGSSGGKGRLRAEYLRGFHHIQSKFRFAAKHEGVLVGPWVRGRYGAAAAVEAFFRCVLFDPGRAMRAVGRLCGAWRYRNPRPSR